MKAEIIIFLLFLVKYTLPHLSSTSSIGRERFGLEHWIGSAPQNRPYDCIVEQSQYIHSYAHLNELQCGECVRAPRRKTFANNLNGDYLHCFKTVRAACLQAEHEVEHVYAQQYADTQHVAGTVGNFISRCANGEFEH